MASKAEEASPVAGADLRNFDLTINSDNSHSTEALQMGLLTRRYPLTVAIVPIVARVISGKLSVLLSKLHRVQRNPADLDRRI
jgi:hypothetical protein